MMIQDIYFMAAQPAHYKAQRAVFNTIFGLLFLIGSIIYYWAAYRPKVGPVGNGPNDAVIWSNFLYTMIVGGCFFTLGMVGWVVVRSVRAKNGNVSTND